MEKSPKGFSKASCLLAKGTAADATTEANERLIWFSLRDARTQMLTRDGSQDGRSKGGGHESDHDKGSWRVDANRRGTGVIFVGLCYALFGPTIYTVLPNAMLYRHRV